MAHLSAQQRRQIITRFQTRWTGCQQLDRNVKATIIRHGNFDYVNNTVVWDPSDSRSHDSEQLIFDGQTIVVGRPPVAADRPRSDADGRPDSGTATFCEWHANAGADTGRDTGVPTHQSAVP